MQQQNYPKHYCGVFGIFGHPNAAELAYYGLYALQHRGQESAGIVTCHDGKFFKHHGMGLVPQIFNDPKILHGLVGNMAVAHTRYSTTGSSHLRNAQPLTVDCMRGQIAVAHNGNLTNAAKLRDELESRGLVFQTTVDSEIIIMMLAQPTIGGVENTLVQTMRRIEGAYSLVIMTEKELIGARDPFGFRPLSHRPRERRVGAGQRNGGARPDSGEIRPRRRAGRNRHHQRKGPDQRAGVSRTPEARVLHF